MISHYNKYKLQFSIFLVWLFHISGIIGISLGFENWFVRLTPLNLLVCIGVIVWNELKQQGLKIFVLLIPFIIGFLAEIVGVHTGYLFGKYTYGENLGYKFFEIPIIIGVNWAILVFATSVFCRHFVSNKIIAALFGSGLMLLLDLLFEISAPRFDFWRFENDIIPLKNYIDWFLIGFFAHLIFNRFYQSNQWKLSLHILLAFTLFFFYFANQST